MMNPYSVKIKYPRLRRLGSRISSLIVLLQKSPSIQFLIPEAKLLGVFATADAVKLTLVTYAGLGVLDSVSGISAVVKQLSPSADSLDVPATTGEFLNFVYQVTGANTHASAFTVEGTLPPGMAHANTLISNTDFITGTPTQAGSYPNIVITAYEFYDENTETYSGRSATETFIINVVASPAAAITQQPASLSINYGETTTLNVTASGTAPFTYQWYQGIAGTTTTPVGTNSSSHTTPALTVTTSYWVNVSNAENPGGAQSLTATVTVVDLYTTWKESFFTAPQLADSAISGLTADPDGDGVGNEDEYIFGTSPIVSDAPFAPGITVSQTHVSVSFNALMASGPGYAGKTRHYAIEVSSDLQETGAWPEVPGFEDVVATGQSVDAQILLNGDTKKFYRIRFWLTP